MALVIWHRLSFVLFSMLQTGISPTCRVPPNDNFHHIWYLMLSRLIIFRMFHHVSPLIVLGMPLIFPHFYQPFLPSFHVTSSFRDVTSVGSSRSSTHGTSTKRSCSWIVGTSTSDPMEIQWISNGSTIPRKSPDSNCTLRIKHIKPNWLSVSNVGNSSNCCSLAPPLRTNGEYG